MAPFPFRALRSSDETTATSSPRDRRSSQIDVAFRLLTGVQSLAQMELSLARHVNRLEQALRAAETESSELMRFFGLEKGCRPQVIATI